uniref:Uncharacterized protein n=1 Tax=Arundo donax TaxID=35708 RepID=A0A0A8Y825_ARUDO
MFQICCIINMYAMSILWVVTYDRIDLVFFIFLVT